MRSIQLLLDEVIQVEFGANDLTRIRAVAADKLTASGRGPGLGSRAMAFIEATASVRRRPESEMYAFVGTRLAPLAFKEVPNLLRSYQSTRSILLQVTRVAPAVLDAFVPGLPYPEFDVELIDGDTMRVAFDGPEPLADLFEGVALGIAQHFNERIVVSRANPPAYAPDRRMVDIRVIPERRNREGGAPGGVERRRFFGT